MPYQKTMFRTVAASIGALLCGGLWITDAPADNQPINKAVVVPELSWTGKDAPPPSATMLNKAVVVPELSWTGTDASPPPSAIVNKAIVVPELTWRGTNQ